MLKVKIEGYEELTRNIKKYKQQFSAAMKQSATQGAEVMVRKIKSQFIRGGAANEASYKYKKYHSNYSPPHRITGEMQRNITAELDGSELTYSVAHIGLLVDNQEMNIKMNSLEYGHAAPGKGRGVKVVPPHPFVRPGVDESKPKIKKIIKKNFEKILK